jgi:hypothetical protein
MNRFPRNIRVLVIACILVLELMDTISAMSAGIQSRSGKKPDPQAQLLNNYRKYVDRYILISGETWKYSDTAHSAAHSLTLKNIAGVAYADIEVKANYLDANGKSLYTGVLKIPGKLAAYSSKKFTNLTVQKLPGECDQAVLTIAKATIAQ